MSATPTAPPSSATHTQSLGTQIKTFWGRHRVEILSTLAGAGKITAVALIAMCILLSCLGAPLVGLAVFAIINGIGAFAAVSAVFIAVLFVEDKYFPRTTPSILQHRLDPKIRKNALKIVNISEIDSLDNTKLEDSYQTIRNDLVRRQSLVPEFQLLINDLDNAYRTLCQAINHTPSAKPLTQHPTSKVEQLD
ncbi:MAG: hypothetical protein HW387_1427 [Parachlamydiales bacterium]|nr:hypothetical protein [Parachlamydiales bacterium]